MANICYNTFLLRSSNKVDYNRNKRAIIESGYDVDIWDEYLYDDRKEFLGELKGSFDSKWDFPIDDFKNIISGDVYFRCISEEEGNGYYTCNIYNIEWKDEQYFELYE